MQEALGDGLCGTHVVPLSDFVNEVDMVDAFITVAERDLMPPRPLAKRLVNHARGDDISESYAADWTVEQLREFAQRVADRIEALLKC